MGSTLANGVTLHADWNEPWLPSINVKMGLWSSRHHFPDFEDVAGRLGICNTCAQSCVEKAFDVQQDYFWRCIPTMAREILGLAASAGPAGRSAGWVSVAGIGEGEEVEQWDKKTLAKWRHFEKDVHRLIEMLCGLDDVINEIQAHGWEQNCSYIKEQHLVGMGGEL